MEKLKLESKNFCVMPSGRFVYEVDIERERHVGLDKEDMQARSYNYFCES